MKNLLTTLCLTVVVILGSAGTSWSAVFQKGLAAYDKGDYATTLREWTPLAEQKDAGAQFNLGLLYFNCGEVVQTCCRTEECPCPGEPGTSRPTKSMNSPCCTPKRKCTSIWIKAELTANSAGLAKLPASC